MEGGLYGGGTWPLVALSLVCSDVPVVTGGVLHGCGALAVELIGRFVDGRGPRFQGASIGCIAIGNVDVKCTGHRSTAPLHSRAATSDHQHGIADPHFAVQAALRAGPAAEQFLGSERLPHEVNQPI